MLRLHPARHLDTSGLLRVAVLQHPRQVLVIFAEAGALRLGAGACGRRRGEVGVSGDKNHDVEDLVERVVGEVGPGLCAPWRGVEILRAAEYRA